MYFEWKNEYSVKNEEIDRQHKHLFELGTRIYDLAEAKDGFDHYDEIIAVLQELKEYTVYHFSHEEKLMEKYRYEFFSEHKFEHFFVIKKIQKYENENIDDKQSETIMSLVMFISDWITNHILKEDMKYKDFFQEQGIC